MLENMNFGAWLFLLFCLGVCLEFIVFSYKEIKAIRRRQEQIKKRRAMWPDLMQSQEDRYNRQFDRNSDKGDPIDNGPITD